MTHNASKIKGDQTEICMTNQEVRSGGDWDCWDVCTKYEKPNTCGVKDCSEFGII